MKTKKVDYFKKIENGTKVKILDCAYGDLKGTIGVVEDHIISHAPRIRVKGIFRGNPISYIVSAYDYLILKD